MTRSRSTQVSLADTPYYHGNARCVRRAFLCGIDSLTDENYEHRREWLVGKMKSLSAHQRREAMAPERIKWLTVLPSKLTARSMRRNVRRNGALLNQIARYRGAPVLKTQR